MNTDFTPDRYDELLILARDSRLRRQWTQRVTASLIVGAIGLNMAYVYSVSQQLESAADDARAQQDRIDVLIDERDDARAERDQFRAEALIYKRDSDAFVSIAPTLEFGSQLGDLMRIWIERQTPRHDDGSEVVTASTESQRFYDLVWLVDGSRRVPMSVDDILWIPQTRSRVKLTSIVAGDERVDVWSDDPRVGTAVSAVQLPYTIEISATEDDGNTNCVTLTSLGVSNRVPADGFIDIDVRFHTC